MTTILFVTLFLALFLVISTKASGEDANLFGYQIKTVLSGSMEPEIKTGSIIVVKAGGDKTRFQPNDVITYITEENIPVTHRITEVLDGGEQYITKGDANDAVDLHPVLAENIVGEYVGFTVPYLGYVVSFATSNIGAALLLILPGILLIVRAFFIMWQVSKYVAQTKEQ